MTTFTAQWKHLISSGVAPRLAGMVACVTLLFLCALGDDAHAAPVHPPLLGNGLTGFNKACGAAVDSQGDVYVASAGESKVKVFDPAQSELTSIKNENTPCGLAVDSEGNLYVSEVATGNVVRYTPNAYPFSGTPTYGAPTTVDASGEAKGIAVDPFDDRLYVAKGTAIDVYTAAGVLDATVGAGDLSEATGVAAYTYGGADKARYVFAADDSGDVIKVFGGTSIASLSLRRTIDGSDKDGLKDDATPDNGIGFGAAGAQLGAYQANGHIFVYDAKNHAVDEFEATGAYLTQISSASFDDAEPTAVAVSAASGSSGRVYVSSGKAAGAELLAFGPLAAPSRRPAEDLSFHLTNACGVAVDSHGNRYVGAGARIHVYDPTGKEIKVGPDGKGIEDPEGSPCDLAVDSAGNVYALDGNIGVVEGGRAVYFTPNTPTPMDGTKYSGPTVIALPSDFGSSQPLYALGLNQTNGHLFVANPNRIIEFDSIENGFTVLNPDFGDTLGFTIVTDIDVFGATGNVYVLDRFSGTVVIVDPSGTTALARISGAGSLKGPFGGGGVDRVAVDQSNGHLLTFSETRGVAEEYEPSGSFLTEFGEFVSVPGRFAIAIDGSGGPTDGDAFVAYFGELKAFEPLTYGEPPLTLTGLASDVSGGNATLNGTVDPRRIALSDCHFEYVTEADYLADGETFASAASIPCVESLSEIGKGTKPVAVHAVLSGLESEERYFFRLVAQNEFGPSPQGDPGKFGPPLLVTEAPQPISYTEVIARAKVDPSGLPTSYYVEYGVSESYGQSTVKGLIMPNASSTALPIPIFGLSEGTLYHLRVVAENEAKTVMGPDQTVETLVRAEGQSCPNTEFRTGLSAGLPDCRAYELVTPADTRGLTPYATQQAGTGSSHPFNNWLTVPSGPEAGERLSYFTDGTLPGFDGTGRRDGYRSQRAAGGWQTELVGPSYPQAGGSQPGQNGVASNQEYSLWSITPAESLEGALPAGEYLRGPQGFELLGRGTLGIDLKAQSWYLNGSTAIFSSTAQLESEAPPPGTAALYERAAGSPSAQVISIKPDGNPFGAGESATYVGSTEDGSAVVFNVGGTLYLRRAGAQTIPIVTTPHTFAGISQDGEQVFYVNAAVSGETPTAAALYVFNVDGQSATEIAPNSRFVNVSADGSRVYFTSKAVLDDAGQGLVNENNLYLWEGGSEEIRLATILDPEDVAAQGFEGFNDNLVRWLDAIGPGGLGAGRAYSPTRSTPSGNVLVFMSRGSLTPYDSKGHVEIYRYDASGQGQLRCVSCDPSGTAPSGEATLQALRVEGVTEVTTVIPNVTDDGGKVFFESTDSLLPEDANSVQDIYEWKANGAGDCKRTAGCLALVSSGQGERDNYLYGMTSTGHDVFFETLEKLVGADLAGSPSIYDAREEGGIPDPPTSEVCHGDACQPLGSGPPSLASPASTVPAPNGNVVSHKCPKGKHKLKRRGKTRCVTRHSRSKHRPSSRQANPDRRTAR